MLGVFAWNADDVSPLRPSRAGWLPGIALAAVAGLHLVRVGPALPARQVTQLAYVHFVGGLMGFPVGSALRTDGTGLVGSLCLAAGLPVCLSVWLYDGLFQVVNWLPVLALAGFATIGGYLLTRTGVSTDGVSVEERA